jgi:hypothetical protein
MDISCIKVLLQLHIYLDGAEVAFFERFAIARDYLSRIGGYNRHPPTPRFGS